MAKKEEDIISLGQEYYQISSEMLGSFPKYRLPLRVFKYKEKIGQLQLFVAREQRMTNEMVEEVHATAKTGDLFVSREDYPLYSKHIIKQLDLILTDSHLNETEIAYICVNALKMRLEHFFEQSVKAVGKKLLIDTMVFTEYISQDPFRIKMFLNRLDRTHSLAAHSVNTLIVGIWILIHSKKNENKVDRKELNRFALGFLMHDVGMSKVPPFILTKAHLTREEKYKIESHTVHGLRMVQKLELGWDELGEATFEHHERLNGSGYPQRTKEDNLSKIGRMCAVADSFSAMITERVYAKAKDVLVASQEIANDPKYDPQYSILLRHALITKEITMNPPKDPEPKEPEPKEPESKK